MKLTLSFILITFSFQAFSQDRNNGSTKNLINKVSTWDNGFKGCYGIAPVHDSIMNILINKGKPVAKQLFTLLDSTNKAVTAHFMLSVIYGDSIHQSDEIVSKTENLIIKQQELNGLIWTTELIMPATVNRTLDQASLEKTKEMWKRRLK